jgi:hypothetical protein
VRSIQEWIVLSPISIDIEWCVVHRHTKRGWWSVGDESNDELGRGA